MKTTSKTYAKRPDTVEAIQFNGNNAEDVIEFTQTDQDSQVASPPVAEIDPGNFGVQTHTGFVVLEKGDYVLKNPLNQIFVSKEDDFDGSYEVTASPKKAEKTEKVEEETKAPAATAKKK